MADGTKIEWTDATVNAVNGCSVVSPGCTNCYAMKLAGTRLRNHPSRAGLTRDSKAGPVWTGEIRVNEEAMLAPLRWARPRLIFWNAHGDLFHENVPEAVIDRCFAVMALTPQHTHQVLTKRSARMRAYFTDTAWLRRVSAIVNAWPASAIGSGNEFAADFALCFGSHLPNVWLGVSVEDRTRLLERASDLKATPAVVRFWSGEPLLGDLGQIDRDLLPDWVIVGGESGPGARPMHPDWAISLRAQCAAAGVPFFFKQWGEWAPISDMDEDLIDSVYAPRPARDPEGSRRCRVDQLVMQASGRIFPMDCWSRIQGENPAARDFAYSGGTGAMLMMKVGKARAGRNLRGVVHDAMPQLPTQETNG